MQNCPRCKSSARQNRSGKTISGSQRYRCMHCGYQYTPDPKEQGYPRAMRKQAIQMYVDGMSFRKIARHLGIHHRTVSLWVKAQASLLSDAPLPEKVDTAELDEMFTFIGEKKRKSTS